MPWAIRCHKSGISTCPVSAVYGSLLPKCLFGCSGKQGKACSNNAESDTCSGRFDKCREKAEAVIIKLKEMKLPEAAVKIEKEGIVETLTYMHFPREHRLKIRSNNVIERLNREIRRRTRVAGTFPDGNSALMLVCARLRHVESSAWGKKRYMSMEHLNQYKEDSDLFAG